MAIVRSRPSLIKEALVRFKFNGPIPLPLEYLHYHILYIIFCVCVCNCEVCDGCYHQQLSGDSRDTDHDIIHDDDDD